MTRGIRRPLQRGIENLIGMIALLDEGPSGQDCLLMAFFRQRDIRCPADLVLYIPLRLTVPDEI